MLVGLRHIAASGLDQTPCFPKVRGRPRRVSQRLINRAKRNMKVGPLDRLVTVEGRVF